MKEVQEVKGHISFDSLPGVARDISAATPIPTKIFKRPFSQLVKLPALGRNSSEADKLSNALTSEAKQDRAVAEIVARENAAALRANLVIDVAPLVARSKTLPLQKSASLTSALNEGIKKLLESLETAENKLIGFRYPEDELRTVRSYLDTSRKLVLSRLAVADLIRKGIMAEKQL